MSEQANTKLVQQAYENFGRGDIPALLGLLSQDVEWRLPEIENMAFTGLRRGREQVGEFFSLMGEAQEPLSFEPREYIAQGDKVVVLGTYQWRVKATGRTYRSDWSHVFTVRGGQVVAFHEYTDSAAAARAYRLAAGA